MIKYAKSNPMGWKKNDPRWPTVWWGGYDAYHKWHNACHEKFVKINAWSWAEEMGYTLRDMKAAMRYAYKVAPYRYGMHGVGMLFKGETENYLKARDKYLKGCKKVTMKKAA